MILYFENHRGEMIPLGDYKDKIDVGIAIRRYIDEANAAKPEQDQFKCHYVRTWDSDGYRHYDVGSHVEFFHWAIGSDNDDYKGSDARL